MSWAVAGIRHTSAGRGHPYRIDPDQRHPVQLVGGDPFELRVLTDPTVAAVTVELDDGAAVADAAGHARRSVRRRRGRLRRRPPGRRQREPPRRRVRPAVAGSAHGAAARCRRLPVRRRRMLDGTLRRARSACGARPAGNCRSSATRATAMAGWSPPTGSSPTTAWCGCASPSPWPPASGSSVSASASTPSTSAVGCSTRRCSSSTSSRATAPTCPRRSPSSPAASAGGGSTCARRAGSTSTSVMPPTTGC